MIMLEEQLQIQEGGVLIIQCAIRRKFARKIYRAKRRVWLIDKILPLFQVDLYCDAHVCMFIKYFLVLDLSFF